MAGILVRLKLHNGVREAQHIWNHMRRFRDFHEFGCCIELAILWVDVIGEQANNEPELLPGIIYGSYEKGGKT